MTVPLVSLAIASAIERTRSALAALATVPLNTTELPTDETFTLSPGATEGSDCWMRDRLCSTLTTELSSTRSSASSANIVVSPGLNAAR